MLEETPNPKTRQLTRFLDLVGGAKPKAPEQKEAGLVLRPFGLGLGLGFRV